LVHTAYDGYSNPEYVYDCACKYKGVRFIMSHLGLRKECDECISYLAERDNLFCDIAWVAVDTTLKVISMVGDKKIMYGSDNPTKGLMTYAYPFTNRIYLNDFQKLVNQETYRKIMRDNAINIFHLKEI